MVSKIRVYSVQCGATKPKLFSCQPPEHFNTPPSFAPTGTSTLPSLPPSLPPSLINVDLLDAKNLKLKHKAHGSLFATFHLVSVSRSRFCLSSSFFSVPLLLVVIFLLPPPPNEASSFPPSSLKRSVMTREGGKTPHEVPQMLLLPPLLLLPLLLPLPPCLPFLPRCASSLHLVFQRLRLFGECLMCWGRQLFPRQTSLSCG